MVMFACAAGFSWLLTGVLVRIGRQFNTIDSRGAEGHTKTLRGVPNIGGIAIWAILVLPIAGGLIMMQVAPDAVTSLIPALAPWKTQIAQSAPTATAFIVCLSVLHMMGVVTCLHSGVGCLV